MPPSARIIWTSHALLRPAKLGVRPAPTNALGESTPLSWPLAARGAWRNAPLLARADPPEAQAAPLAREEWPKRPKNEPVSDWDS